MKKLSFRALHSCVETAMLWGEKTLHTHVISEI